MFDLFSYIRYFSIKRDDSFRRNTLGSLRDDLVQARQKLADVKPQRIACLKEFLDSDPLNQWVKTQIESKNDLCYSIDLRADL